MTRNYKQAIADALPGTLGEIAAKSGARLGTVVRWLRIMRDADECHVGSWKRADGAGGFKRVYVDGPGRDAPCRLKRLSNTVYSARYRASHPDVVELRAIRTRGKYWADKAATTPQSWASALGVCP